jgi:hypothetical protein
VGQAECLPSDSDQLQTIDAATDSEEMRDRHGRSVVGLAVAAGDTRRGDRRRTSGWDL